MFGRDRKEAWLLLIAIVCVAAMAGLWALQVEAFLGFASAANID